MKKVISLLLTIVLLFFCCVTIISCSDKDNSDDEKDDDLNNSKEESDNIADDEVTRIDLTKDYIIVYDRYNPERTIVNSFVSSFKEKYGKALEKIDHQEASRAYELQIGTVSKRNEYSAIKSEMNKYSTVGLGVSLIRVVGENISVAGSCYEAVEVACDEVSRLIDEDGKLDKKTDKLIIFDLDIYKKENIVHGYSIDEVNNLSSAYAIKVSGKNLEDFSPEKNNYNLVTTSDEGYPDVTITPLGKGTKVTIIPASAANSGVAKATITSPNGQKKSTYTLTFEMVYAQDTSATLVNPNGKSAVVSYVIDDGQLGTARISQTFLDKYPSLELTYALIGRNLVTLNVNTATNEYVMVSGKYQYTQKSDTVSFWREHLTRYGAGRVEYANHSFNHAYAGNDDSGGLFNYYNNRLQLIENAGDPRNNNAPFVKGSLSKEILASTQILEELFPANESKVFVYPGIDVSGKYEYNGITGYRKLYEELIQGYINSGKLIGCRWFDSNINNINKIVNNYNTVFDRQLLGVYSLMTLNHHNPDDWIKFIQEAEKTGGLAVFCMHNFSETAEESIYHIKTADADKLFKYTDDNSDKIETMNITDALMYFQEMKSAKVSAQYYGDIKLVVSATDELNDSVYNMPLTAKVTIPASWESATYGGQKLTIYRDDAKPYIYVPVTPDGVASTVYANL